MRSDENRVCAVCRHHAGSMAATPAIAEVISFDARHQVSGLAVLHQVGERARWSRYDRGPRRERLHGYQRAGFSDKAGDQQTARASQ